MPKSTRPTLSALRDVSRLLGDVRDLRGDVEQQDVLIVDRLVDLVDASHGFGSRCSGFLPGRAMKVDRFIPGTQQDPVCLQYMHDWAHGHKLRDDPLVCENESAGPLRTFMFSENLSMRDPRYQRIFEELWEPTEARDMMLTLFRYPGSDVMRGFAFHRTRTDTPFQKRDRRLLQHFIRELRHLHLQDKLENGQAFEQLPARYHKVAALVGSPLSQQQIADRVGLKYQTVRTYLKEMYDLMGVGTRRELAAKLQGSAMAAAS